MKYVLYLDSFQSTSTKISNPSFQLNQPIVGAMEVKVVSLTFGNNLHNVVADRNTLVFNTVTVTVPPGYYTTINFVQYVNTVLMANVNFLANLTTETSALSLDAQNNVLWTIGGNFLQSGTLLPNFGITSILTGNFQSFLFLAQPSALAISCSQLHGGNDRFVSTKNNAITNIFYVGQIRSGFGEIEQPNYDFQFRTQLSRSNLSQIDFFIFDPSNGREITELNFFSLILEITAL